MARLMTAEGSISRTSLGKSTLTFGTAEPGDPGIFIVRSGFGPGDMSHRRITVDAPYVVGRYLVHAVPDVQTSILKLRVRGSSQSNLIARMNEVIEAFSQFSYSLSVNINHKQWTYQCEMADYTWGEDGNHNDLMTRSNQQLITFSIPHSPIDTGGYTSGGTHGVIE